MFIHSFIVWLRINQILSSHSWSSDMSVFYELHSLVQWINCFWISANRLGLELRIKEQLGKNNQIYGCMPGTNIYVCPFPAHYSQTHRNSENEVNLCLILFFKWPKTMTAEKQYHCYWKCFNVCLGGISGKV